MEGVRMEQLRALWCDVTGRLKAVRYLLERSLHPTAYLQLFDEYLEANELELALNVLCDFLLEPTAPAVTESELNELSLIHSMMELDDEDVELLRRKRNAP